MTVPTGTGALENGHLASIDASLQGMAGDSLPATGGSNPANEQAATLTAGAFKEVAFTATTAQAVGLTDVSNYKWVGVQITEQGSGSLVTFEGSNDGINWYALTLADTTNNVNATLTATGGTSIYSGPLPCRYFQLNVSGISGGTTAGVIEFYTSPTVLHSVGTNTTVNNWASNPAVIENPWQARIIVGQGFSATTGKQTSGGVIQVGVCLFNNSTGKNILIYSIRAGIAASSLLQLNLVTVNPAISGVTLAAVNSAAGNGTTSSATLEAQNTAVSTSGTLYDMQYCAANSSAEFLENDTTILLPAGSANGVLLLINTSTNVWFASMKYIEY